MNAPRLLAFLFLLGFWATVAWADVYCPACGNKYPDTYNYCPKDGTDLAAARKAAQDASSGVSKPGPVSAATPAPSSPSKPDVWPTALPSGSTAAPSQWPEPAAQKPAAASPATGAWAADLPIQLPSVYPDANLGDFALYEWTEPGSRLLYLRVVLKKGEKGHVSVVASTLSAPGSSLPPLNDVLERVDATNSKRAEWYDYRDFAKSFELWGKPLLSPFVGSNKATRVYKKDYPVANGRVGCEVAEFALTRDGKKAKHVVRMSEQVPFAFVESTYDVPPEKLRLVLFGTLDEDELGPLERLFP